MVDGDGKIMLVTVASVDPLIVKNPELKEFFRLWWIMTKSHVEGHQNKFFFTVAVDDVNKDTRNSSTP